ncbi:MAG: DNA primase [Treponema sp.]|jgi:DNA primase|nr:DNA primase [Treponema sp.]
MPRIAQSTINEVNDKLDALSVMNDYLKLEKKSGRYWGLCPFHNEKTPSFTVDPDRKMYHCFGCGKGGGIISFIMEMDKLTFPETVEMLAKRFGVEIVYDKTSGPVPEEGEAKKTEEFYELYRRVTLSFHHFLMEKSEGRRAYEYLLDRGISRDLIARFRLGYAPQDRRWLHGFLSKKGYSPAFLAECGLFSEKYPQSAFFSGRLMFPITDRLQRTIAFGGRILGEETGPKYINSRDSAIFKKGRTLFAVDLALQEIRRTKAVYLTEGYMDVIALHQAGICNAVAPLGTAFTDEQAKLLRRWAEKAFLVFDSDTAGQSAAYKGILTCRRNALTCEVLVPGQAGTSPDKSLPAKDPADILKIFGSKALQNNMKCFINDFDYLLERGRILFDTTGSEGKTKAVAFLFPYLEALDSDVSRDTCITAIADAFRADKGAVQGDYNRRLEQSRRPSVPQEGRQLKPIRGNEELHLLTAVAVNNYLYPQFRSRLSIQEIEDPAARELFVALEECYVHEETGVDDLLSRISEENLRNYISEKGNSQEFSVNPEQLVEDGTRRVKQRRLKHRLAEIVVKLRTLNKEQETGQGLMGNDRLEDLLAEKKYLDIELRNLEGR